MSINKIRVRKTDIAIHDGQFFSGGIFAFDTEVYEPIVQLNEPHRTLINLEVNYKKDSEGLFMIGDDDDRTLFDIFHNIEIGHKAELTNLQSTLNCVALCNDNDSNELPNSLVEFNNELVEALYFPEAELYFDKNMTKLLFVVNGDIVALICRIAQESLDVYQDFEGISNTVLSVGHINENEEEN